MQEINLTTVLLLYTLDNVHPIHWVIEPKYISSYAGYIPIPKRDKNHDQPTI